MEKADVVVIGTGGSGLVAALTAAECDASVIIFEKRAVTGGTSNFPSGVFAVESKMQRQKYVGLTKDEAFRNFMEHNHWRANARLVRAFVNKSAFSIDWLQRQGVEFIGPEAMCPGGHRTMHHLEGGGSAMVKALVAKSKEKGIEIRLATPVKKIVKDKDRIKGVIAQDKSGETVQVNAKAVIIATGGYTNNKEWIKKYTGFDLGHNLFTRLDLNLTGDGIQMAWEVGAAEKGIGVLQLQLGIPGPGIWETQIVNPESCVKNILH